MLHQIVVEPVFFAVYEYVTFDKESLRSKIDTFHSSNNTAKPAPVKKEVPKQNNHVTLEMTYLDLVAGLGSPLFLQLYGNGPILMRHACSPTFIHLHRHHHHKQQQQRCRANGREGRTGNMSRRDTRKRSRNNMHTRRRSTVHLCTSCNCARGTRFTY